MSPTAVEIMAVCVSARAVYVFLDGAYTTYRLQTIILTLAKAFLRTR